MQDIVLAVASAFFGALAAFVASLHLARLSERRTVTDQFVNEFYADQFTIHRRSLWITQQKVVTGSVTLEEIARGYWYPGSGVELDNYRGEEIAGFDEHQHLEAYMGYIVRLDHALARGRVDRRYIRSALAGGMVWHADLLSELAAVAAKQSRECDTEPPSWALAVDAVHQRVSLASGGLHPIADTPGKPDPQGAE